LSDAQIQMARQLGMNPNILGSLTNHKQEMWKLPLPQYIENLYQQRFGNELSNDVKPQEVRDAEKRKRKADRKNFRGLVQAECLCFYIALVRLIRFT
jgi:hypothetical protein